MKPEELIKIVFKEERVDFELVKIKRQNAILVQARQRSAYLLHYFFPLMINSDIMTYFGYDRPSTVLNSYKRVTNYIATEKKYEKEMAKLIHLIRAKMERESKYRRYPNTVVCKMKNKRAILYKGEEGYVIVLKRLSGRNIELQKLSISDEALQGIIESYQILNK